MPRSRGISNSEKGSNECWGALAKNCRFWSLRTKWVKKRPPRNMYSSNGCHQLARTRRIHDHLDQLEVQHHKIRLQVCATRDTVTPKKKIFCTFPADSYWLNYSPSRRAFESKEEIKLKRGPVQDFFGSFHFYQSWYTDVDNQSLTS